MKKIRTYDEAAKNILVLDRALGKPETSFEARELLKKAWNYLVLVTDDGLLFGPSRFVGYRENSVIQHTETDFPINGTKTDEWLCNIGTVKVEYDDLGYDKAKAGLFRYLKMHGVERHKRKLSFFIRPQDIAALNPEVNICNLADHAKRIAKSVTHTVSQSGKSSRAFSKAKSSSMTELEIEKLVVKLFNAQEGVCPLTGVSMTLNGDSALFPSLDRIDSLGNYEPTNLQLVCRFANFWKGAEENAKFKKLIALVKSA